MKTIFSVYKTDEWHRYNSREIIGIATSEKKAIHLCVLQAKKEGENIGDDQMFNLINYKQTQGYAGAGEFQFEEMNTDILL